MTPAQHNVRCLLLDMGKVLLDFDYLQFGRRMLALTGLGIEQLRSVIMADDLTVRLETGRMGEREFHREICNRVGTEISWTDFVEAWNSVFHADPLLPEGVIACLAERADLWLISNTNKIHSDFIFDRYKFPRFFRGRSLSHEVGVLKPDRRIFEHALRGAGIAPVEALFVDDQSANVEGAKQLGIDGFQFLSPERFVDEMKRRRFL